MLVVVSAFIFYQELFDDRFYVVVLLFGGIIELFLLTKLLHRRPINTMPVVIIFLKAILDLSTPILNRHERLILIGLFFAVGGL